MTTSLLVNNDIHNILIKSYTDKEYLDNFSKPVFKVDEILNMCWIGGVNDASVYFHWFTI